MDKTSHDILTGISKIYDEYEDRANQLSQEKIKMKGKQIDKKEKLFMTKMNTVIDSLYVLIKDLEKSPAMKSKQLRNCPRIAQECYTDIQGIAKKKNLLFKVDDNLTRLVDQTQRHINTIKQNLNKAGETKFLCCGYDGEGKFKSVVDQFKLSANQWKLLSFLQPKDSVQNFISPKFVANEFRFVKDILMKNWPKQAQTKIVEKQVIKYVKTGNGKVSRLVQANQYIYGINRETNVSHGLKIYHEEADTGEIDSIAASAYLGQIYEEGVLLSRDLNKAVRYYQKAMKGNDSYANYRFAVALIKGELNKSGINREDIQKGVKLLEQAATAQKPSAQALVELGQLYERGYFLCDTNKLYNEKKDLKKAIAMYKKAKDLNLPRAANNLGVLYIQNKNMSETDPNTFVDNPTVHTKNIEKGKALFEQAMEQGYPQAFYNLGNIFEHGLTGKVDKQQALSCFYEGGLKGDHMARLRFVYELINQTSTVKEEYDDHYRLAYHWLESILKKIQLNEQNKQNGSYGTSSLLFTTFDQNEKAEVIYNMGLMNQFGFGVEKNPKRAFNYYLQSGDLKHIPAKNKLGDCYFCGYGIKQDRKIAIGYYIQAAEEHNSDAMVNLGTIYLNGIPEISQRNYDTAYEYFLKAMELDNPNAMIHLSFMYKNGLGFDSNPEMAKKLLQKAANEKNQTALYMLKQMGGNINEKTLNNFDNQFQNMLPKKINLKQIIPLVSALKI